MDSCRLLVVSNRLPTSITRNGEQSWSTKISGGGLVSALLGVKNEETKWIGWAGLEVKDEIGQKSLTNVLAEKRCIPVFLDNDTTDKYYNGYCNCIIWPILHYLGIPQDDCFAKNGTYKAQYDAYKKANKAFADVIMEHYREGDIIWIHDYHLMLLPKYLKDRNSNMKIGFFLHTTFPPSEIWRTLPEGPELLRSLLASDMIGLHTYDLVRHFVSTCSNILGLESTPKGIVDQGKLTRISAFPIGIDADNFINTVQTSEVKMEMKRLKEKFGGRKIILGVERLDTIKGIPHKILAFERFLEENPEWRDKVVLVEIGVPSRSDVPEYQKLKIQIHELVSRVNGRFGTFHQVPIHHLDQSVNFPTLCALYAVSDVALITSLRDGMNLVSYEYVASQTTNKGVLILSEVAGAAQCLGAGAILVNPWNTPDIAASISRALTMPAKEREKRHQHNLAYVKSYTAQEWANDNLRCIHETIAEAQIPKQLPVNTAIERCAQSENRMIILGFDAEFSKPLAKLCKDPRTTVVVLSKNSTHVLDENFGDYKNMWLAAENGMFLCHTKGSWTTTMPECLIDMEWVDEVQRVFQYFTKRTPGSHIEVGETALIWNYESADAEFGRLQARDLLNHLLESPISKACIDITKSAHSVEVRVSLKQGAAIGQILGIVDQSMATPIDYALFIGNSLEKDGVYTVFEPVLPSDAGTQCQKPNYESLNSCAEAVSFLKKLADWTQ
ncbi:hypothetical protein SAY86_021277 [Trapa natans]|uniref:alpha,alpha-trehalose-phosphate synthase (UDP-forming) n=1 Tax=Trapa natans TaxID=22666 RepID=A0AAN7M7M9_TRANT|nr:hypothetical protein SAY86_021277 [Trapa natans]